MAMLGGVLVGCSGPQPHEPKATSPATEESFAQQLLQAREALDSGDLRAAEVWLLAHVQRARDEPQALPDYLQLCDDVARAHLLDATETGARAASGLFQTCMRVRDGAGGRARAGYLDNQIMLAHTAPLSTEGGIRRAEALVEGMAAEHARYPRALQELGKAYASYAGRTPRHREAAERYLRRALARYERQLPARWQEVASTLLWLGKVALEGGRLDAAVVALKRSLTLRQEHPDEPCDTSARTLQLLADVRRAQGDAAERELREQVLVEAKRCRGVRHGDWRLSPHDAGPELAAIQLFELLEGAGDSAGAQALKQTEGLLMMEQQDAGDAAGSWRCVNQRIEQQACYQRAVTGGRRLSGGAKIEVQAQSGGALQIRALGAGLDQQMMECLVQATRKSGCRPRPSERETQWLRFPR